MKLIGKHFDRSLTAFHWIVNELISFGVKFVFRTLSWNEYHGSILVLGLFNGPFNAEVSINEGYLVSELLFSVSTYSKFIILSIATAWRSINNHNHIRSAYMTYCALIKGISHLMLSALSNGYQPLPMLRTILHVVGLLITIKWPQLLASPRMTQACHLGIQKLHIPWK